MKGDRRDTPLLRPPSIRYCPKDIDDDRFTGRPYESSIWSWSKGKVIMSPLLRSPNRESVMGTYW